MTGNNLSILFKTALRRCALIVVVLLLWWLASTKANPIFVPAPKKVFADLLEVIGNGTLFTAISYSFLRITIATFISAAIAIPVGLLVYNNGVAKEVLGPIVSTMRYIPVTAFYPLLIMWFGIEESMKVAFLFIATFVYMMPSVVLCLDEISENLIDTGLTIGMSKLQTILHIQIPATMPSIANSFIMMYGIGFTYISVAETVNAKYGLGYIIQQSSSRGRTDMVFMAIIVIMLISVSFDYLAKKLVRTVFRWRYLDD
jgi:NitT/TauT family transport system permease protein